MTEHVGVIECTNSWILLLKVVNLCKYAFLIVVCPDLEFFCVRILHVGIEIKIESFHITNGQNEKTVMSNLGCGWMHLDCCEQGFPLWS